MTVPATLKKVITPEGKVYYEGSFPSCISKSKEDLKVIGYDEENVPSELRSMASKVPAKDGNFYLFIEELTKK